MTTPVRLSAIDLVTYTPGLAALLVDAVDDGAGVGFLSPLPIDAAAEWWATQAVEIRNNRIIVWATSDSEGVTGTIQLRFAGMPNSRHRAAISKLLVHRRARGNGIARELLSTAEQFAAASGRSLLTLDTQTGSGAERLYKRAGWIESGAIPSYAADASGVLRSTTIFHKHLV
ncbi:GNAT family N-acetyltransferase [Embleya scabrispora]|uniref:GNAT family N-acetyltransferase n=1 Tax=Embleya scabrispora TaxID=159449 RepID=A0A1T3P0U4_9ACTN|nr:GNAT family N-acetyltransferase [Embleya scabrispora]OPC82541.1 GNAT family N-acetyltransferase [Embleya scabrispora]